MPTILPIYDFTPFTMLDFPERTACIVWFAGCNMRCAYCHNPQIVRGRSGRRDVEEIEEFLQKRRGLLDGVVFSGGEATLYKGMVPFARRIKEIGYAVKLDTNGTRPEIIRQMLEENLLDYIALDYKAPPGKSKRVTGVERFQEFRETLSLLCDQDAVPFEVRTTVHTALLEEDDIGTIMDDLDGAGYRGTYYIQNFRLPQGGTTLKPLPESSRTMEASAWPVPKAFSVAVR